jgi:MoaA/NifB/PqqE/SkfB family radical SAM enzyme
LHPDIFELVSFANNLGFEVMIQTNGTLMSKDYARKLRNSGVNSISFSIHTNVPLDEDNLMKGENVLERQLQGLRNSIDENISSFVATVVTKMNYKSLPDFYSFMIDKYPEVTHYVINFVDPVGRAEKNFEAVPKYFEVELYLFRALAKLRDAGKTFRVERVPLCYMTDFAEYSTETRRIVTKEPNMINRGFENLSFLEDYFSKYYIKGKACEACRLAGICAGILKRYFEMYGESELYPVFLSPEKIVASLGPD